jgi:DNA-binding NtrC family response regulator
MRTDLAPDDDVNGATERLRATAALGKLVGRAPAFLEVVRRLLQVAPSDAAVLLLGETGTGKELAARALHYLSPRAPRPFVAVNCGTLPETLLEGELFGHEKGAFTDAHGRQAGLVAQAERGTLFLDEVDSLPRRAQVALLRVLQEKRFRPVGGASELAADVRIVAACNAPLDDLVRTGGFRADLYYRLAVFLLRLPPLRERREDIEPLALHFLARHAPGGRPPPRLSDAARGALLAHDWPGNVRELENAIVRGCHLCAEACIEPADMGLAVAPPPAGPAEGPHPFRALRQRAVAAFERAYLTTLLAEHGGNVTRAARAAGQERRQLGKLLKKHDLNPAAFRPGNEAPP